MASRVDADDMSGPAPTPRYAVPLHDLEASVRVPPEEQTSEQPSAPRDLTDAEQLDAQRQLRLAGGA